MTCFDCHDNLEAAQLLTVPPAGVHALLERESGGHEDRQQVSRQGRGGIYDRAAAAQASHPTSRSVGEVGRRPSCAVPRRPSDSH